MENLNIQTQIETPKDGVEYLRGLAADTRDAGFSQQAFDIEAAADKIEQQAREIEALTQQAEQHQQAAREIAEARRQDDDRLAAALMAVIGDRVEAIAEQVAGDAASDAAREEIENLDISNFEYEIGEMIDDRLPDQPDEDDNREAVESIVREVLAGATLTIDI